MKNRNGLIRGLRFRSLYKDKEYARTITANAGTRATDNYIIVPAFGAIRGRKHKNEYQQVLEINKKSIINAITTVQNDKLMPLILCCFSEFIRYISNTRNGEI